MQAHEIRGLFTYDSGYLYWKRRPRSDFKNGAGWYNFNNQFAGTCAGAARSDGRREIKIDGKSYKAARVIWAYHYSEWPTKMVDHINGDRSDDRIENLRLATPRQNAQNRSVSAKNSSGFTGISWHAPSDKWWVRITIDGKTKSFGLYEDLAEACLVAINMRKQLFGNFARDA